MNTPSTPTVVPSKIDDLFTLNLVDGLAVESGGKVIKYYAVKLRETNVADERIAQRWAERVAVINGIHKLVVSDADFRYCLTTRHIESFHCDGLSIPGFMVDMALIDKLSSHDFGLIESRVFLITMAAEVRYGNLPQAEFDRIMAGGLLASSAAPQRSGQTEKLGQAAAESESGPSLLADFTGTAATGTASSNGR